MKKILSLFTVVITLFFASSCSKDNEAETSLTVMSNVTFNGKLAYPSLVRLYDYDKAKDFDKTSHGIVYYGDRQELLNSNDEVIPPAYTSLDFVGANIFEDVKAGKYIIIAMYHPEGYSFPSFFYYGYAEIEVNYSNPLVMRNFTFTYETKSGQFIKF